MDYQTSEGRTVVSVALAETNHVRLQAASTILGLTPSQLINRACDELLSGLVNTEEYQEALADYRRRWGS
mgnify:CR=1 FL=1